MNDNDRIRSATSAGDRALVVSRVFDAPREVVFKAWTDPRQLARWFAPEPLTVPKAEADVRPGGRYTLVMRDQDGTDFTSTGEYVEVVEPERVVYMDSVDEMPSSWVDMLNDARGQAHGTPVPPGVVTLEFEDVGGRTKVTFREDFDSRATRDAYVQMQMVEGLEGSLDNLEKLLSSASVQS